MDQKWGQARMNLYISIMKTIFHWARKNDILDYIPNIDTVSRSGTGWPAPSSCTSCYESIPHVFFLSWVRRRVPEPCSRHLAASFTFFSESANKLERLNNVTRRRLGRIIRVLLQLSDSFFKLGFVFFKQLYFFLPAVLCALWGAYFLRQVFW